MYKSTIQQNQVPREFLEDLGELWHPWGDVFIGRSETTCQYVQGVGSESAFIPITDPWDESGIFTDPWIVDFYGKLVGYKYTKETNKKHTKQRVFFVCQSINSSVSGTSRKLSICVVALSTTDPPWPPYPGPPSAWTNNHQAFQLPNMEESSPI